MNVLEVKQVRTCERFTWNLGILREKNLFLLQRYCLENGEKFSIRYGGCDRWCVRYWKSIL